MSHRARALSQRRTCKQVLVFAALVSIVAFQAAVPCEANTLLDFDEVSLLNNETSLEPVEESKQQIALKQKERLTVIAPRYLRPNSDYHVLINLANSRVPATIDLQLIGARDSNREQTEAKSVLANSGETQTVKFAIGDWPSAEYVLSVSAQAIDRSWNFSDERPLVHRIKRYSGFIQTDKAIYKPGQAVQFRVLTVTPTLTPHVIKSGINVTVQDPRRNIIKQWQELSNYRGLLSLEMPLTDDPMLGDYTIKVEAQNQEFSKQFTVAEYVLPTFDVQIQLPPYATYNESDIVATVRATYTYGKPVRGHVTLTVQPLVRFYQIDTRPLQQAQFRARLEPDGTADFPIDLIRDVRLERELFEREIEFFALVEEDLTGRKYNRTQTTRIYAQNIKIERLNPRETFKPGMRQLLQYKVAYQDNLPVEDNGPSVELRYSFLGQPMETVKLQPQAGLIEHELDIPARVASPQSDERLFVPNQLEIQAHFRNQVHHLDSMNAYQSESHQYLKITLPQLKPLERQRFSRTKPGTAPTLSINDDMRLRVQGTEPMQQVTCQGFARGDIVWALSRDLANKTEFQFEVKLDHRMAPEMRIICFHVRPQNKELIADSISVQVGGLAKNLVKLAPGRDEAKPGQEVEVGVFTKPNSLVGVLAVDQSVLLLKSGNDLSQTDIMSDIKSYGTSESGDVDASNTANLFEAADVVVLSNNLIYDGFGTRLGRPFGSPNILMYARAPVSSASNKIALDSLILDHELQATPLHLGARPDGQEPIRIRTEFPETWLWQNGTADERGQARFQARLPDTITSWELSAFSLSEAHGLALSSGRNSIRVFRPFFIKLNLPYAIIRGETVSIQAIVFNYSKRPVTAKVTLDNRARQFEFVEAANAIEDEKRSSSAGETRTIRIPAQEGASVSWLVQPVKLGHIDIRVVAQADTLGDGLVKKLLVKPEGQTQHLNKAMLVQLGGGGGAGSDQDTWRRNVTIEVPANAVEGSQKVFVSAIGDILGAGLSHVDDLLRLPYGCGEQNMINLVPNLVILNYLQNTNRLRESQRERALKNLETGYQRELNYRRPDGSFSAFGPADKNGSVWLTAYVLKTLQQAKSHVTVDERVLQEAAQFIGRLSQPDGSIGEIGMLHNKALASAAATTNSNGGAGDASGSGGNNVYLTAYSMIALLQRPVRSAGDSGHALDELIGRGLDFLERQVAAAANAERAPNSYELAIIAYTLQLAGGARQAAADRAYEQLWALANEAHDQVWWSSGKQGPRADGERESARLEVAGSSTPTPPPLKPLAVDSDQSAHLFMPDSLSVEQTAWALLAATRRQDLERALPIVRWLVGQQNSRGGFASTQDTVLAIEALASYAEAVQLGAGMASQRKAPLSIDVEFIYPRATGASQSSLRRTNLDQVLVRQSNALVQQQTRLPDNITWVQVQATGQGTAVVQVSWQYNLLVSAERPAFYLNPILDRNSNINYLQLSICTFYKGSQQAEEGGRDKQQSASVSNMAVMEVELPSGYVADVEALASLKRHKQIKRIDTEDGETRILIYLDRVTRDELCLTVSAHRSSKVSNNRPVPVSIYDYYDRKQAARIFYEPKLASSCDICDPESTCGDQCGAAAEKPSSRSGRLISLHEQRRMNSPPTTSSSEQPNLDFEVSSSAAPPTRRRNDESRAKLLDANELADAKQYIPLTSAFQTLVGAIRQATPRAAPAGAV